MRKFIMTDPQNSWLTHESRVVYDNPWIQVREDRTTTPAGTPGRYGVVSMKHLALGVVPLDADGCTWLVGQWRYPLGAYSWEIPEGGGRLDEDPLLAIQRELREETGLTAARWQRLLTLHNSNSVTDEAGAIYLAEEICAGGPASPEETEALTLRRLPLAEALAMIDRGEITDSMSVAGLLAMERLTARRTKAASLPAE